MESNSEILFYSYHKIPSLYLRDIDGTKKLLEGQFSNECFEYLKDLEWEGTEKLDGTNIGIVWDGNKVRIQGRTPAAAFSAVQFHYLTEKFCTPETEELFEQHWASHTVVFYGELIGKGIQACGSKYCEDGYRFVLFDVFMPTSRLWGDRATCDQMAKTFGVESAEVVFRGTLEGGVNYVKTLPQSKYGNLPMEGIVMRPYCEMFDEVGTRLITKIKARDFVMRDKIKEEIKRLENNRGIGDD